MWPWRRRVEVVLAADAGDDATAALTMILRHRGKPVTFDEVRDAIYGDRTGAANMAHVLEAAERFGMHGRGLQLEDRRQLAYIPAPSIVHLMWDRGAFPRSLDGGLDGYFVVVTSISPQRVRWIDPYVGPTERVHDAFFEIASGVVLVLEQAQALPGARLHGVWRVDPATARRRRGRNRRAAPSV
jgi:ABC-type bacteriocin/lantibiotic exporter with double-glycine peptidase domain